MKLWTVQSRRAWELAVRRGVLRADGCYTPDFFEAYQWMRRAMTDRIGDPPSSDDWPIWAWTDPRHMGYVVHDTDEVTLEFDAPASAVLLSGFLAWHSVLNGGAYLPNDMYNDEEYDRIAADPSLMAASWNDIFDPRMVIPDGDRWQATLWRVPLSWVSAVYPASWFHHPGELDEEE